MGKLRTVLIGLGTAALLGLPGLTDAQYDDPDPFGSDDYGYSPPPRRDYYEEQRQTIERALNPFPNPDHDRIREDFRNADRINARQACMAIDRNPAAQAACLEGLR